MSDEHMAKETEVNTSMDEPMVVGDYPPGLGSIDAVISLPMKDLSLNIRDPKSIKRFSEEVDKVIEKEAESSDLKKRIAAAETNGEDVVAHVGTNGKVLLKIGAGAAALLAAGATVGGFYIFYKHNKVKEEK